ncbi:uncharacterized protein PgNI_09215 [Pyricularia grisea]|uniref:Uncharacterized protein n=1 Tax=Pyricularia grisea TaxID=148305 RepID=A0A6P8ATC6_PYRGI|nr:uncharacterized protein PgNI_09215 [Pyricularia grisea]TLD05389.1 hypothetical protein PgNI_09215 [Pyricularia grisea]
MRSPSQDSSDCELRGREVQVNKPLRPALPTSLENVNNAPVFTSPRRSIDDRLRKHENQPKRVGMGLVTGSRAAKASTPFNTGFSVTNPSPSQLRVSENTRTSQSFDRGSSRIPRLSVSTPQSPRSDSLDVDVRINDHTLDPVLPNTTIAPTRSIQPSDDAKDIIIRAIAVAESDISRYKGLGRTFNGAIEQLTSQIIRDFERAGLATIQVAATDAAVNSQNKVNLDISEEMSNKLKGGLSLHEDRIIKRLESHHLGMRNHESKVGNEIKSLINSQITKIITEIHELGRTYRSHRLTQRSELTPPTSEATGSSGRKRPRTSSPSIVVENTNN